ncbi:hypothetical protein BaRGS_00021098, partial [Batillaria attramentaria]
MSTFQGKTALLPAGFTSSDLSQEAAPSSAGVAVGTHRLLLVCSSFTSSIKIHSDLHIYNVIHSDNQRVVLLGKTGAGKSSLGNTLLGREAFLVARGLSSGTEKCLFADAEVTDTPGLCDTHRSDKEVLKEISKSVALVAPGPHVILMVLRCDRRFTEEEYYAYTALKKLFGDDICKFMIVVFAGMDALGNTEAEQQKVLIKQTQSSDVKKLQEILSDARGRFFGINNVAPRDQRDKQARKLLAMMKDLVKENHGNCFRNKLCEEVGGLVEERVQQRMQQNANTTRAQAEMETKKNIVEEKEGGDFWPKVLEVVSKALTLAIALVEVFTAGKKGGASEDDTDDTAENVEATAAAENNEVRILVIGKTGNGKSSVCNTILGREEFKTGRSMSSTTLEAQTAEVERGGRRIKVIDTPDITNCEMNEQQMQAEVSKWKTMTSPHPTIIVLTVRCDVRYTQEEHDIYRGIKSLWGDNSFCKRLVVAFTFGDLQGEKLEEELKTACGELQNVLKDAGRRYAVFDNGPKTTAEDKARTVNKVLHLAKTLEEKEQHELTQQHHRIENTERNLDFALFILLFLIILAFLVLVVLQE